MEHWSIQQFEKPFLLRGLSLELSKVPLTRRQVDPVLVLVLVWEIQEDSLVLVLRLDEAVPPLMLARDC